MRRARRTLALVVDLLGSDDLVDDGLEEVVLPRHPGGGTGRGRDIGRGGLGTKLG